MLLRRLSLSFVIATWLAFLFAVHETRWNIGATYANSLGSPRAELPLPTRYLALPVLAHHDGMPFTVVKMIGDAFWLALFLPPVIAGIAVWRAATQETLLQLWGYGATSYMLMFIVLIAAVACAMWLPFQRW